jgi:DNA polymerase-4
MKEKESCIIHVNVTEYTAAVTVAKNPSLADTCFAIALEGSAQRVIITPSRRAWEEGIRPGMAVSTAQRMLPKLQVLPPDVQAIAKADQVIASIVQAYSPHYRCDKNGHAYLDMSGTTRLFGPVVDSALRLRRQIREQACLESSVAVASNKLVAKIGTRAVRPFGLTQIRQGDEASFLASQDVSLLCGIGRATKALLNTAGITQIGEIAALDDSQVIAFLGKRGLALRDAARGLDVSVVHDRLYEQRTIKRKVYFSQPVFHRDALQASLVRAAEDAASEMRSQDLGCSKLSVALLWSDGRKSEATRKTKGQWIYDHEIEAELFLCCMDALERRVSLLAFTIGLSDLEPNLKQQDLFSLFSEKRTGNLQASVDAMRSRFGSGILTHATALYHEQ